MHNRDHLQNPHGRCNRRGQCIYGFPQPLQQATTIDESGRIHWRRFSADDAWVVSYNPTLLEFANCHFHFDVVFTSKVFTYLYKYLYKGEDITQFTIAGEPSIPEAPSAINEVADYQKARYLSAPESAWRLLGFHTTRKEPAVECLPVHLPGQNTPQFRRNDGERSSTSLLHRYFLRSPLLHDLTYEQYFEQFVLYSYIDGQPVNANEYPECHMDGIKQKKAARRCRTEKIARIDTVPLHTGATFLQSFKCSASHDIFE